MIDSFALTMTLLVGLTETVPIGATFDAAEWPGRGLEYHWDFFLESRPQHAWIEREGVTMKYVWGSRLADLPLATPMDMLPFVARERAWSNGLLHATRHGLFHASTVRQYRDLRPQLRPNGTAKIRDGYLWQIAEPMWLLREERPSLVVNPAKLHRWREFHLELEPLPHWSSFPRPPARFTVCEPLESFASWGWRNRKPIPDCCWDIVPSSANSAYLFLHAPEEFFDSEIRSPQDKPWRPAAGHPAPGKGYKNGIGIYSVTLGARDNHDSPNAQVPSKWKLEAIITEVRVLSELLDPGSEITDDMTPFRVFQEGTTLYICCTDGNMYAYFIFPKVGYMLSTTHSRNDVQWIFQDRDTDKLYEVSGHGVPLTVIHGGKGNFCELPGDFWLHYAPKGENAPKPQRELISGGYDAEKDFRSPPKTLPEPFNRAWQLGDLIRRRTHGSRQTSENPK